MPRGATAAREKKWEEAAVGVGDVPFHPDTLWRNLRHAKEKKKCNKDPKTRTAICQLHQFRPFDRIAGRTDTMTCSARLEQLFSDRPLYSIVVSESWNRFSGIHIIFSFLHRYLTFLETREILSLFTPGDEITISNTSSGLF